MKNWFVASTHTRCETKALINLNRQGFKTYFPRYEKQRRHARRVETVLAPLFPGYVFVNMDLALAAWQRIQSTFGVKHLICAGDDPLAVPPGVVEGIIEKENQSGVISIGKIVSFKKGDAVKVTMGAMVDQTGIFDCATSEERVAVLLDLLGRRMKVHLPVSAISSFT